MITSNQNNFIKQVKKLHTRRERHKTKTFLIEGFHLLEEAVKSKWIIEQLIVRENVNVPEWGNDLAVVYVSEHVFNHISQTETPQGIAGIVTMKEEIPKTHKNILLIDAVQDPGNLGTIIRTADAAGFTQVVLGRGTVDLYNDKVIRATQGSLFHIDIIEDNLLQTIPAIKEDDFTVYASTLENANSYKEVTPDPKVALILGNEGAGISEDILHIADERIHIPIYGKAESLNVSIAAGILMYALI